METIQKPLYGWEWFSRIRKRRNFLVEKCERGAAGATPLFKSPVRFLGIGEEWLAAAATTVIPAAIIVTEQEQDDDEEKPSAVTLAKQPTDTHV